MTKLEVLRWIDKAETVEYATAGDEIIVYDESGEDAKCELIWDDECENLTIAGSYIYINENDVKKYVTNETHKKFLLDEFQTKQYESNQDSFDVWDDQKDASYFHE